MADGQIGYRERLRARKVAAAAKKWAAEAPADAQLPETVTPQAPVSNPAPVQPVVEEITPVTEPTETETVVVARTPADIRAEAELAVELMLSLPDDQYTARMTAMSEADPMLYAAVSDMIANKAAMQTETETDAEAETDTETAGEDPA